MYQTTTVFPKKFSFGIELENTHPVIIDLTGGEDLGNLVRIFLTKEKAKELFLELELALGEFQQKEKMVEMDEADPSLV